METKGKIGVFDSGLGGLWMLSHIRALLPEYDYVFFGDQAYVPYGNKTDEELFLRAQKIFAYLFETQGCTVILLACNTTSTTIFTKLQEWVRNKYPDRHIWGLVRPTIETIPLLASVLFFGTHRTIDSHVYKTEMEKLGATDIEEIELPELATRIEHGGETAQYIQSFNTLQNTKKSVGVLVCTHYGIVREDFKKAFPQVTKWIYQEDIIPIFIKEYLNSHLEINQSLSKLGTLAILVSKENDIFNMWLAKWYGKEYSAKLVTV